MYVHFYKTNYNLKNRPYVESVIPTTGATGFEINGTVYPDTPFIVSKDVALQIFGGNYDYIFYIYNEKNYYAFIVAIEPIMPKQKDGTYSYKIIHKTDPWLTYNKNITISGIVERAHVNDYYIDNDNKVVPSLKYTYNEAECEMLSGDIITNQYSLLDYADNTPPRNLCYLYVLYNKSTLSKQQYKPTGDFSYNGYTGLTLLTLGYNKADNKILPIYAGDTLMQENLNASIKNLTSSNIVAMFFSPIPPSELVRIKQITDSTEYCLDVGTYFDNYAININEDNSNIYGYITNLVLSTNISLYNAVGISDYQAKIFNNLKAQTSVFNDPTNYKLYGITKLHTSAYLPIVLIKDKSLVLNSSELQQIVQEITFRVFFDPNLYNYYLEYSAKNQTGLSKYDTFLITSQFVSLTENDYWTKLNAQASIANSYFNSAISAVNTVGSLFSDSARTASNQFDKNAARGSFNMGVGVVNTTINALGNVLGDIQRGYNLKINKEINTRLINEGIKNLSAPNFSQIYTYGDEIQIVTHSYKNQSVLLKFANRLHKYGYETRINLDDYFSKHRRKYFNFVKCSEITVGGIPQQYALEIEDMFLNGVTFWTNQVKAMQYNVVNRQINESEDNI